MIKQRKRIKSPNITRGPAQLRAPSLASARGPAGPAARGPPPSMWPVYVPLAPLGVDPVYFWCALQRLAQPSSPARGLFQRGFRPVSLHFHDFRAVWTPPSLGLAGFLAIRFLV